MTPAEFALAAEAGQHRDVRQAWMMAALSRAKKMPSLDKLTGKFDQVKQLTGEEKERRQREHEELVRKFDES